MNKLNLFLKKNLQLKIIITCLSLILITQTSYILASDISQNAKYADLRSNFLNINEAFFSEIDIASMSPQEIATFLGGSPSPFKVEEKIGGVSGTQNIYGANHACMNQYGIQSICWFNTGGTRGIKGAEDCGASVSNDYQKAITDTSLHCKTEAPWSGFRFWLGTGSNFNYINDSFPNAKNIPTNRLCAEVEFPSQDKLRLNYTNSKFSIEQTPNISQIVNPEKAGEHLRKLQWEWGTYTATKTTAEGATKDEEYGGTYQNGGSHFYHKPTSYGRTPADRIFAIDNNTLAICMGDIPTGVRSGMRPSYAANPLLTLGGIDDNGITTAPSYLNYVTRIYLQANLDGASIANYPFDIKINKLWMMYEENGVFATSFNDKGTLGLEMIEQGETAYHPFIVHNVAKENRDYRIFMAMGGNLVLNSKEDWFRLFIDSNNNGILDDSEKNNELTPSSIINIEANTDMSFILAHTPDFTSNYQAKEKYSRMFSQGSISFIEEGRMRSASYAVRTWQGSTDEQKTKEQWFAETQYPAADSAWAIYHDFNLGKDLNSNPNLLRNTPDFKNIFTSPASARLYFQLISQGKK